MNPIMEKYDLLGGEHSFLGMPQDGDASTPDGIGRYRQYQYGSIHWHPRTGAHETHGAIRAAWSYHGWECGFLGYPTSDELDASEEELHIANNGGMPDSKPASEGRLIGKKGHFENGIIFWIQETNETIVFKNYGPCVRRVRMIAFPSINEVSRDLLQRLNIHNAPYLPADTQLPSLIVRRRLQECGLDDHQLQQLAAKPKHDNISAVFGAGATAYILVQVGNYFVENPQSLNTLGAGAHGVFENWDAITAAWEFGNLVGFGNVWSAIDTATQVTDAVAGYGLLDLAEFLADLTDLQSFGAAAAATYGTKKLFDWINHEKKQELGALEDQMKHLGRVALLADKAAPPALLKNEISQAGTHHFAY